MGEPLAIAVIVAGFATIAYIAYIINRRIRTIEAKLERGLEYAAEIRAHQRALALVSGADRPEPPGNGGGQRHLRAAAVAVPATLLAGLAGAADAIRGHKGAAIAAASTATVTAGAVAVVVLAPGMGPSPDTPTAWATVTHHSTITARATETAQTTPPPGPLTTGAPSTLPSRSATTSAAPGTPSPRPHPGPSHTTVPRPVPSQAPLPPVSPSASSLLCVEVRPLLGPLCL